MAPPRPIPNALLRGPFRTQEALALGVSLRRLQSSQFRRHHRDVWSSTLLEDTIELRCAAAKLLLPRSAVICGLTAARLYGLPVPGDDRRIHVALPPTTTKRPEVKGIKVHRYRWRPEDLRRHRGILIVQPDQLFIELAARLERIDLIIVGDAMLRRGLTNLRSLKESIRRAHRIPGVRPARAVLPHLEPNADSPPETRMRMILVDGGLPRPIAGANVSYAAGGHLAQVDLLYEEERIAIFYDGGHHDTDPAQNARDRTKARELALEGYLVLRYDKRQLFRFPHVILNDVRNALDLRRRAMGEGSGRAGTARAGSPR